jgi:hypothetical protein
LGDQEWQLHVTGRFDSFVLTKFATKNPQELWHLFLALHFADSALYFRGGSSSDRKPLLSLVGFALLVLRQQGLATFQRNKVRGAVKFHQSWGQRVANHNQHLSSEKANPHQNPLPVRMPVMSSEEP